MIIGRALAIHGAENERAATLTRPLQQIEKGLAGETTLLQGASLLKGTGHCYLLGLLISCRRRVSVAARPFAAPCSTKARHSYST